jgi:hypothetical protein
MMAAGTEDDISQASPKATGMRTMMIWRYLHVEENAEVNKYDESSCHSERTRGIAGEDRYSG